MPGSCVTATRATPARCSSTRVSEVLAETLSKAMRSNAENHYNGGDYAGACRIWGEVLDILNGLERRGALAETDRNNALAQTRDWTTRACNPPRGALGPSV
jgi:hypothetical protein